MRKLIENMYIDYANNFLSVYRFAEYYNIDEDKAFRVIEIGRKINHTK